MDSEIKASRFWDLTTEEVFRKSGRGDLYDALRDYGFNEKLGLSHNIGSYENFYVTIQADSLPDKIEAVVGTTLRGYTDRFVCVDTIEELDRKLSQIYSDMSRGC